eukprot:SAG11_NODE_5273_length_1609_cov_1.665563_2_plen_138_part_00
MKARRASRTMTARSCRQHVAYYRNQYSLLHGNRCRTDTARDSCGTATIPSEYEQLGRNVSYARNYKRRLQEIIEELRRVQREQEALHHNDKRISLSAVQSSMHDPVGCYVLEVRHTEADEKETAKAQTQALAAPIPH